MFRNPRALAGAVLTVLALLFTTTGCSRSGSRKVDAEKMRLPDGAYRVEWTKLDVPSTMAPGSKATLHVTVKNTGNATWPNPATADPGAYAVRLSHRWWPAAGDGKPTDWEGRTELPAPLAPGDSVTLTMDLKAPAQTGEYKLQLDLVQELVAWFEGRGAAKALVPVSVR